MGGGGGVVGPGIPTCRRGAELYSGAGKGRKHQSDFLPSVPVVERVNRMEAVTGESQAVSSFFACVGGEGELQEKGGNVEGGGSSCF